VPSYWPHFSSSSTQLKAWKHLIWSIYATSALNPFPTHLPRKISILVLRWGNALFGYRPVDVRRWMGRSVRPPCRHLCPNPPTVKVCPIRYVFYFQLNSSHWRMRSHKRHNHSTVFQQPQLATLTRKFYRSWIRRSVPQIYLIISVEKLESSRCVIRFTSITKLWCAGTPNSLPSRIRPQALRLELYSGNFLASCQWLSWGYIYMSLQTLTAVIKLSIYRYYLTGQDLAG